MEKKPVLPINIPEPEYAWVGNPHVNTKLKGLKVISKDGKDLELAIGLRHGKSHFIDSIIAQNHRNKKIISIEFPIEVTAAQVKRRIELAMRQAPDNSILVVPDFGQLINKKHYPYSKYDNKKMRRWAMRQKNKTHICI